MGNVYTCDVCDCRMSNGYTVAWSRTHGKSASAIHFSSGVEVRNVCADCWPVDNSPAGKLKRFLRALV